MYAFQHLGRNVKIISYCEEKLLALNTYAFLAFIMYDQIAHQRDISVYMASNLNAPLCKNSYYCLYFIKLT